MAENFLTCRSIRTRVDDQLSEEKEILKDVHKEVFSAYYFSTSTMADLPFPDNICELSLFVDDAAIYCTTQMKEAAEEPVQFLLGQIEDWAIGCN